MDDFAQELEELRQCQRRDLQQVLHSVRSQEKTVERLSGTVAEQHGLLKKLVGVTSMQSEWLEQMREQLGEQCSRWEDYRDSSDTFLDRLQAGWTRSRTEYEARFQSLEQRLAAVERREPPAA